MEERRTIQSRKQLVKFQFFSKLQTFEITPQLTSERSAYFENQWSQIPPFFWYSEVDFRKQIDVVKTYKLPLHGLLWAYDNGSC